MCPEWTKKIWSGRLDSNQRPLDPQSSALTRLRYAPTLNLQCISYARARIRFSDAFFRARDAAGFRAAICLTGLPGCLLGAPDRGAPTAPRLTGLLLDAAATRLVT